MKPERLQFVAALRGLESAVAGVQTAFEALSDKDKASVQDSLTAALLSGLPGAGNLERMN